MLGLDPKMIRLAGHVSAVGIEIVVAITIGYLAGRWLDNRLDTSPYLTIFFSLAGVGAGIKALVRTNREFQRRMRAEEEREEDGGDQP